MYNRLVTDTGEFIVDDAGNALVSMENGPGYYFCSENNCLYSAEIYPTELLPESVKEISKSYYDLLLSKQAQGCLIKADENGFPIVVNQNCGQCNHLKEMCFVGTLEEGNFNDLKKPGIYDILGENVFANTPDKLDREGILVVYNFGGAAVIEQKFYGVWSYRRFYIKDSDDWSYWVKTIETENGSIDGDLISDESIETNKIAAGAVTAKKLAAGAVTAEKLAAGAVTAEKLADNSVTAEKISDRSIDSRNIKLGAINESLISNDSISNEKIKEKTIASEKFAENLTLNVNKLTGGNAGNGDTKYLILDNTSIFGDLDVKYNAIFREAATFDSLLTSKEIALPVQDIVMGTSYLAPIIRSAEKRESNIAGVKIEISFDGGNTWNLICSYMNNVFKIG